MDSDDFEGMEASIGTEILNRKRLRIFNEITMGSKKGRQTSSNFGGL
jgi:hypothetical protein